MLIKKIFLSVVILEVGKRLSYYASNRLSFIYQLIIFVMSLWFCNSIDSYIFHIVSFFLLIFLFFLQNVGKTELNYDDLENNENSVYLIFHYLIVLALVVTIIYIMNPIEISFFFNNRQTITIVVSPNALELFLEYLLYPANYILFMASVTYVITKQKI